MSNEEKNQEEKKTIEITGWTVGIPFVVGMAIATWWFISSVTG